MNDKDAALEAFVNALVDAVGLELEQRVHLRRRLAFHLRELLRAWTTRDA